MRSVTSSSPRHQVCCIPHDPATKTQPSKMFMQSGAFGLHAIATQDMPAGTVILQCLPLAHSLLVPPGVPSADDDCVHDKDARQRRCLRCFSWEGDLRSFSDGEVKKLMRCSRCKIVFYCSRSCQVRWYNIRFSTANGTSCMSSSFLFILEGGRLDNATQA